MLKSKINKNIYKFRILLIIVLELLIIMLLPNIILTGNCGKIFLIVTTVLLSLTIASLISKNQTLKKSISYNLIYIGYITYITIVALKLLLEPKLKLELLYQINLNYFKINYIMLSIIGIGIIITTIILLNQKDS